MAEAEALKCEEKHANIYIGFVVDMMEERMQINGKIYEVALAEDSLSWKLFQNNQSQRPVYHHLKLSEIITAEYGSRCHVLDKEVASDDKGKEGTEGYKQLQKTNSLKEEPTSFTVFAVKRSRRRKWRVQKIRFHCPDTPSCKHWVSSIKQAIAKQEPQRPKKLIVFINPVGGKGHAREIYYNKVAQLFELAGIETEITGLVLQGVQHAPGPKLRDRNRLLQNALKVTEISGHAKDYVQGWEVEKVDGIVCVGGDGTFAEVVNGLLIRTQKSHTIDVNDVHATLIPPNLRVGVIPAGSTDVIAYNTTGVNDPVTSALQIILGYSLGLDICSVHNNNELVRYTVSFLGYGFFGDMLKDSENYRWIGPHRYEVAGAKKYLRNQSYCGEVAFLPSTDEDHNPWDKATCRVGCGVCLRRQDSQQSLHGQQVQGSYGSSSSPVQSNIDPDTGWKTMRGEFICVNAALVAGMCGKTPHGVSPTAHLGNGCVDLVLVKKCSRINYLRHMLRLASGANHLDFNFVEVHRVKAFKFRPLRREDLQKKHEHEASYQKGQEHVTFDPAQGQQGSSLKPIVKVNRQSSMTSISSWNIDGEIGDAPDVDVRVHCQLIKVFARGRESAAELEDRIRGCCSFGTNQDIEVGLEA